MKRSVLFCFCLWISLFVVSHGSHRTELVSNNSANEIPALAVARNRAFLMPKYSLNADILLSITHTYTQLQTLDLQSVILCSQVFGEDLDWGAYFLYLFPNIHKSALSSECVARKKLQGKSEFETLRNRRKQVMAISALLDISAHGSNKENGFMLSEINLSGVHYRKNIKRATGTSIWRCRVTVMSAHNRNLD